MLKDKISKDHFKHFLMFSVSMRVLLTPKFSAEKAMVDYAGKLLLHFGKLYGDRMLVYNVHSLIHLHQDAFQHGALDKISAFPFENYLGKLKKLLKKPNHPLQQVVHRLMEIDAMQNKVSEPVGHLSLKKRHFLGPLPDLLTGGEQYKKAHFSFGFASIDNGNNFVQVHSDIVFVRNIVLFCNAPYIVCSKFEKCVDFFTYPVASSKVGIFLISDLLSDVLVVPVGEIQSEVVAYPELSKF